MPAEISPVLRENDILDYGRGRWTLAYERHPQFHRDIVIPKCPFDIFDLEDKQAFNLVESSFFIAKKRDVRKLSYLTYSQATLLNDIAMFYSVFLWTRSHRRLPEPGSTSRIEKSMGLFVSSIERRAGGFVRLQDAEKDRELRETAARLADEHRTTWEKLRRVLSTALAGYSEYELAYYNRYHFIVGKLKTLRTPTAHKQIRDEEWAYLLGGSFRAKQFRRVIGKITRLIGEGRIVLDRDGSFVPAADFFLGPCQTRTQSRSAVQRTTPHVTPRRTGHRTAHGIGRRSHAPRQRR